MLNASEKFWIQSKPVSSCRALLPVLIASGLNFNLNSPICLTNSLLSSQPLSFLWSAEICLNSAGVPVWKKPAIRLWMFSSSFIPLQHDARSWSAGLLSWISQSIPLALLEWDCSWEMENLSNRRSSLHSKYPDNLWPQLKSLPNRISMAFCCCCFC